ncbi:MAG TPA: hypothetical protein VMT89_17715, partial [Candidatus Acidoferrales bacterium]|nr:hypothetical protein [Candidatus Acidoferrales bacterium]
ALNGPATPALAFITATDFQVGSWATISLDEPHTVDAVRQGRVIGSDAIARTFGGLIYVINRFGGDNVQVLDPQQDFKTLRQCSTGPGTNPNDLAFVDARKAYVPLFASKNLLIANPSASADCSDFVLGNIDLSAYADADGIPDMNQAAVVGDRVYVSLERLSNFVPAENGAIIEIDTTTNQVLREIDLTGQNPFGMTQGLVVHDGSIYVSEIGAFGVNDGGIERVDLSTGTAQGYIITEAEIGGDVTDFVVISDQLGYAVLSKSDFSTALVSFNPSTRSVSQPLLAGSGLTDIELNKRGELYLSDRNTSTPGVRIFRASDGMQLTTSLIDIGLPPFGIVFLEP